MARWWASGRGGGAERGEPDPQELLPEGLRESWAVLPRGVVYQVFVVGAILGAGAAVSVVGVIVGSGAMFFGFPVALGVAQLQNWVVPWERGAVGELRGYFEQKRE